MTDRLDEPITFTIEKDKIVTVDEVRVRVELGISVRELLKLMNIDIEDRKKRRK